MFATSSTIHQSKHKKGSNSNSFLKEKGNKNSFIRPIIQTKLSVGKPNDKYEKEADQVADRVMKMPANNHSPSIQRKCNTCDKEELQMKPLAASLSPIIQKKGKKEEEEMLQMKQVGNTSKSSSTSLESSLQKSKGGGKSMDASTQNSMGNSIGADFSNVKIHTNENAVQMNRSLSAKAFTNGNDIYFNSGQYNPKNSDGKRLLAHELAHVVQQKGSGTQPNLIQRYFDANGTGGSKGKPYRVADDLTAAVKVGYPNHEFYAKPGKAAAANAKLAKVGSGIVMAELSSSFTVSDGSKSETLKEVGLINMENFTFGDNMKLIDDCGKSCAVVVGSKKRTALHHDALTGTYAKTAATSPAFMKAEIMKKLLDKWLTMASTDAATKVKINATITKANAKMVEVNAAKTAYNAAVGDADKKAKSKIYWSKVEAYGDAMMTYYNTLPASHREKVDKYLKINKYVDPDVGQGYTMSSGGTDYAGKRTWNFHWGGVIMKSDDKKDTITLENYAVPGDVENERWDIAMYGTAAKKGQTFHEQHHDTKQHGDKPTTMKIEKK